MCQHFLHYNFYTLHRLLTSAIKNHQTLLKSLKESFWKYSRNCYCLFPIHYNFAWISIHIRPGDSEEVALSSRTTDRQNSLSFLWVTWHFCSVCFTYWQKTWFYTVNWKNPGRGLLKYVFFFSKRFTRKHIFFPSFTANIVISERAA